MKLETYFSTPIWYDMITLDNDHLLKFCYSKQEQDFAGVKKSNNGGWQSKDFSRYDEIPEFGNKIKECFNKCFEEMGYDRPNRFVSNSWININKKGNKNNSHIHSQSLFSGVYYVKAEENCGNIFFDRNVMDMFLIGAAPVKESRPLNSCKVIHKPVTGKIIIFPSYLVHYVEENLSDTDRISIAFNCSVQSWEIS